MIKHNGYRNSNFNGKNAGIDETTGINSAEKYLRTAGRFRWAKWILVVALVLFVLTAMIFNSREITLDNINYLFRYINIQTLAKPAKPEFQIEFDEYSSICYYRNNIAVLKRNKLEIYDMNGRKNFNSRLIYSNPVVSASDKYILAYDLGANKLEVFNSFSKLFEYTGNTPIYNAKITDKGNIVYVTTEKGFRSSVKVLNSGFNEIYRCFRYKDYIVDADIDDNAKTLAVAGFVAEDGDYLSRILLYDTGREYTDGEEQAKKVITVRGELPYGVKLNETGLCAVFENSINFYDSEGSQISSYNFAYRPIQSMLLTQKYASIALNEQTLGNDNRILIFDSVGKVLYDNIISAEIIDIKFSDDYKYLYFLARTGLFKIDINQKIFELVTNQYDETTNKIIYANDKNIFLSGLVKVNIVDTKGENNKEDINNININNGD